MLNVELFFWKSYSIMFYLEIYQFYYLYEGTKKDLNPPGD